MIDLEKEKRKRLLNMWWDIMISLSSWAAGLFLCAVIILGLSAVFYILIESVPAHPPQGTGCVCEGD